MKKYFMILLTFLFFFLFVLPVEAEEYELNKLIPVESTATVHTDKFDYTNFTVNTKPDEKGNGKITFASIRNNTKSKTAVSINILLFDENKKNVGYLTYCSDKDYSNEANRGIKLNGGEGKPYTIDITSKFFVEEKSVKDVFYFAVEDENPYCHVGGYDKYAGQTLEEIQGVHAPEGENPVFLFMERVLQNNALVVLIVSLTVSIVIYLIICSVLNNLHYKMYGKKTILCYLPIANEYLGVKMAFGKIIALVFLVFYLLAGALSAIGLGIIVLAVNGVWIIAFIVDIIKIITRNYDLFIVEPTMKNKYIDQPLEAPVVEKSEPTLDLSYDNKDLGNEGIGDLNISSGSSPIEEKPEENKEDSDLTKLFH